MSGLSRTKLAQSDSVEEDPYGQHGVGHHGRAGRSQLDPLHRRYQSAQVLSPLARIGREAIRTLHRDHLCADVDRHRSFRLRWKLHHRQHVHARDLLKNYMHNYW